MKRGQLGSFITLKRGYDLPHRDRKPGDIPIISSSGTTGTHNQAKVAGPGVVTGRYGTLGEVFFTSGPYWPLNTALYVQDFKGNDPRFVFYFLQTLGLGKKNAAGAVPGVNRNVLHKMEVSVPDRPLQRRIAGILSSYDDLIENNTRRMGLLEESIHLLYREWFVYLRFPGHERVAVVDGVPEGWRKTTLEEACASLEDGDWVESKDQGGSDYRLLQVSNIGKGRFVETGKFRYVTQETFDRLRCREVVAGDILISRMPRPIGRAWLVTTQQFRMITAVDVAIAVPNTDVVSPAFLVAFLNSENQLLWAKQRATGATRPRVSRRVLKTAPLLLPARNLLDQFSQVAEAVASQVVSLQAGNAQLREARDTLLPRLMDGRITV